MDEQYYDDRAWEAEAQAEAEWQAQQEADEAAQYEAGLAAEADAQAQAEEAYHRKYQWRGDNCICAEWDGEGWSTCGAPCPEHITVEKLDRVIAGTEGLEKSPEPSDLIARAFRKHLVGRLTGLRIFRRQLAED